MPIRNITIRGKRYPVYRSDRRGKKFKVIKPDGSEVHFGAREYSIAPGTSKGDRYCSRSSGIPTRGAFSPNNLSRKMWRCAGKRSLK